MFNKIVLVGNLTRDIELKYTAGGTALANTAIATSRKFTSNGEKKDEVCFVDITFFGRSGEVANQYLRKGSKILVEGRLKLDQWTDQQGQKRSKHSVIVETMQMLDTKEQSANLNNEYSQQAPSSAPSYDHSKPQGGMTPSFGGNQNNEQAQSQDYSINQNNQYVAGDKQQVPQNNNAPFGAQAQQQASQHQQQSLPEYDIDEDEIPF